MIGHIMNGHPPCESVAECRGRPPCECFRLGDAPSCPLHGREAERSSGVLDFGVPT